MIKMSRSAVILRNIASNWVGYVVSAAVTLVLTPFVLNELGAARYGIWILTSSFVGYYGFLDLGFRAGVAQYLTRYLSLRDYDKASETLSSAVVALSLLAGVVAFLSILGAYIAPRLIAIPSEFMHEAFWCILIVGLSSAIEIVYSPYAAIFTAMQRFDLSNLIGIGTRLLTAVGIFTTLKMGYGLIGVSAAFCGANIIDYLIRWQVARRLAPELNVSWQRSNIARFREVASFGGWNFLISINAYVYNYVPNIMIAAFMPIAAIGYYALATGLLRNVNSILVPIGQVIYPVAVEIHAKGNKNELVRLYHDGSRLMMLVMISIVLGAMFWSDDFYRLWVGEKYVSGAQFHSVALVFQILICSTFTTYISSVAGQILIGAGRVQAIAKALICGSILNLSFSVILIRPYGLAGIAAATVIASVLIDLITIPLLLQKIMGLSIKDFLRRACVRPAATAMLQVSIIMTTRYLMGRPENWQNLILQGFVAGIGIAITVVLVGLTRSEQERFVMTPMQRLLRRNKPH